MKADNIVLFKKKKKCFNNLKYKHIIENQNQIFFIFQKKKKFKKIKQLNFTIFQKFQKTKKIKIK